MKYAVAANRVLSCQSHGSARLLLPVVHHPVTTTTTGRVKLWFTNQDSLKFPSCYWQYYVHVCLLAATIPLLFIGFMSHVTEQWLATVWAKFLRFSLLTVSISENRIQRKIVQFKHAREDEKNISTLKTLKSPRKEFMVSYKALH